MIISRDSFAVRMEWCHFQVSLSQRHVFDFLKIEVHVSPYTTSATHLVTGCHAAWWTSDGTILD